MKNFGRKMRIIGLIIRKLQTQKFGKLFDNQNLLVIIAVKKQTLLIYREKY
jgi:hypothetical protein